MNSLTEIAWIIQYQIKNNDSWINIYDAYGKDDEFDSKEEAFESAEYLLSARLNQKMFTWSGSGGAVSKIVIPANFRVIRKVKTIEYIVEAN